MKRTSSKAKYYWAFLAALAIPAYAADSGPIRWDIADGMTADKAQAVRIYEGACSWIEDHYRASRSPVKPPLTIHVGEACPDNAMKGPCFSSATAELYIPQWDNTSASAVAHATLISGLIQLMDRDEMRRTVARLLSEEARDFVTASNFASKPSSTK